MLSPIVLFFYIFQFPIDIVSTIPSLLISSSTILLIPFIILFLVNSAYQKKVNLFLKNKLIRSILWSFFVLIIASLLFVIFRNTNDYSFTIILLPQFIQLIIGIIVLPYILESNVSIKKLLVEIFCMQSIIEFMALVSPTFLNMTNIFRISRAVERSQNADGGARATGIAIVAYFGLAIAFAVVEFMFVYFWKEIEYTNFMIKISILILIIFGGIIAGRTSFIGFIFGILVVIVRDFSKGIKIKKIHIKVRNLYMFIISLIILIFGIGIIVIFNISSKISEFIASNPAIQSFQKFTLRLFVNYQTTGKFTDNSVERLKTMYFPISIKSFFWGDALFTNKDKTYYMHTDAGYMRQLLYSGVFGFLYLVWYQFKFIKAIKPKFFSLCLLILLFILNYKGVVIGTSSIIQSLLLALIADEIFKGEKVF
ncbi:hypothetical protein ACVQ8P_07740 [Dellaglioa sp. BT-FLS60]